MLPQYIRTLLNGLVEGRLVDLLRRRHKHGHILRPVNCPVLLFNRLAPILEGGVRVVELVVVRGEVGVLLPEKRCGGASPKQQARRGDDEPGQQSE